MLYRFQTSSQQPTLPPQDFRLSCMPKTADTAYGYHQTLCAYGVHSLGETKTIYEGQIEMTEPQASPRNLLFCSLELSVQAP